MHTHLGTTCVHFWGIISSVPPDMIWRKMCLLKKQEWLNDLKKFRVWCVTVYSSETPRLLAISLSHQHGGTHGTSCHCALPVPSRAGRKGGEERRCLSAAMGSPTLALQSPLPSPDMLFAGKWGMENEESELQSHRNIPGSQPRHETKHCFLRDFVSWTLPLAFPSMCWIFFKSFVNKSPFCLFFFFFFLSKHGAGKWELRPVLQSGC